MRIAIALLLVVHGLIHFLGAARGLGLAEVPQLTGDVSRPAGIAWAVAGVSFLAAAGLCIVAPRSWWVLALPAVLLSQLLIVTAWSDARFGTIANVLVALLASHAFAAYGPFGLRAAYEKGVEERLSSVATGSGEDRVEEADLSALPEPVRSYLRRSGAVGAPRVTSFRARWRGRIRGGPEEAWMSFTAEQHNGVDPPVRFFLMDAVRGGLPVDVFHAYRDGEATMTVRLLSAIPMVRAAGPELTRAETVTLLNDLAILAPAALVDPAIRWEAIDDRAARATLTVGTETISAELRFDDAGDLVDFVSDDRLIASADGATFTPRRWSTPLSSYRSFGDRRAASSGTGLWHPTDGAPWAYIELELVELEMNPSVPVPR